MSKIDLQALADGPMMTPAQKQALQRKTAKHGHAAAPGSGPASESCKTCRNLARNEMRGGRVFLKCALRKAQWTGGYGTDVRAKDPACSKWQALEGQTP